MRRISSLRVRRLLSPAAAAGLLLAVAACGGGGGTPQVKETSGLCGQTQATLDANPDLAALISGAAKEGEVDWGNGLEPEEAQPVVDAFHAAFPCVIVKHTRISDDDSRASLLREMQAGRYSYDVMDISGGEIPEYEKADLLKKVDWKKIFPKIQDIQLDTESGALLSIGGSIKVVAYNTQKVKPEDVPDTWDGFTDPKMSGKFVVDSKPKFLYQLTAAWGEDKVLEYARALAANKPRFERGQSQQVQLLSAGELSILLGTYYQDVKTAMDKGAPIAVKFLDPVPDSLEQEAVLKGAKDPNSAVLLLGWLAAEGNKYYDQVTHRGLPLPGFDTEGAKLVGDRSLSTCAVQCARNESVFSKDVAKALGLK